MFWSHVHVFSPVKQTQSVIICNKTAKQRASQYLYTSLTSPVQPHSGQPHSILDPPETSFSADSTSRRLVYWGAGLHHQMASPEKTKIFDCE